LEGSSVQAQSIEKAEQSANFVEGKGNPAHKTDDRPGKVCDFCGYDKKRAHGKGECPAKGKRCNTCKKRHHFAHAPVCPGPNNVRAVDDESTDSDSDNDLTGRMIEVNTIPNGQNDEEMVEIKLNNQPTKKVLIPEEDFKPLSRTTKLIRSNVKLRPYGTQKYL